MTTFTLKILALICMVLDHIGAYIPDMPVQMRWIGRQAAPVFVFCLCEGIDHTSNEKKYLLRIYIASLIMAVVQYYTKINANIFRTLFVIAVNLVFIKHIRKGEKEYKKYYLFYILYQVITLFLFGWMYIKDQSLLVRRILPAIVGSAAFCEGGVPWVILGIVIYLCRTSRKKLVVGMGIYTALYALLSLTNITTMITDPIISLSGDSFYVRRFIHVAFFITANAFRPGLTGRNPFTEQYQWMMILSVIPMCMYNGKKGRSMKWFFYAFNIIHLVILWYIEGLLTGK